MKKKVTMSKKETEEKTKLLKCKHCKKKKVGFHYHQCKRAIQEYYGCLECDNWCTVCKPNWNDNV